jgi:hypothetical protein
MSNIAPADNRFENVEKPERNYDEDPFDSFDNNDGFESTDQLESCSHIQSEFEKLSACDPDEWTNRPLVFLRQFVNRDLIMHINHISKDNEEVNMSERCKTN